MPQAKRPVSLPDKIRLLVPAALLPLLALAPSRTAQALAPAPFYSFKPTVGGYRFTLPLHLPFPPGRGTDTRLEVNELTFTAPIKQFGKGGPKLSTGGVAGAASLRGLQGTTEKFGKLGLTLSGIRLLDANGKPVTLDLGVRGKGYEDAEGKRTGGVDVGVRAKWRGVSGEVDWYDLWRKGEDVVRKGKGTVSLPHGFQIEGTWNTESHDPGVAVSKAVVLKGSPGGRGPPRYFIAPEVGLGLRTKTPYWALAMKAGRVTLVGVQEPYNSEGRKTIGTHFIVSVDLNRIFGGGEKKPSTHSELRRQGEREAGRRWSSVQTRERRGWSR